MDIGRAMLGGAVLIVAAGLGLGAVRAADEEKKPANDVGGGYIPYPNKQGEVVFSHLTHNDMGFQCADCHTKIFPMKRGSFKMTDLYAKKACATCHNGKTKAPKDESMVAFDVMTTCNGCHMPKNPIVYKPKGFAPVTFDHAKHTANGKNIEGGYSCGACHTKLFQRKAGTMTMPAPHATECATCHDGKSVSPSGAVAHSASDMKKCSMCHKAPTTAPAKPAKPVKGKR